MHLLQANFCIFQMEGCRCRRTVVSKCIFPSPSVKTRPDMERDYLAGKHEHACWKIRHPARAQNL
jgi:hypothetical protein